MAVTTATGTRAVPSGFKIFTSIVASTASTRTRTMATSFNFITPIVATSASSGAGTVTSLGQLIESKFTMV